MHEKMIDNHNITFIRGATTASGNSVDEIEDAVVELINELISRNNLIKTNLLFALTIVIYYNTKYYVCNICIDTQLPLVTFSSPPFKNHYHTD